MPLGFPLLLAAAAATATLLLASKSSLAAVALLVSNITAFVAFGYDKMAARQGARRIPEALLHIVAFVGAAGATAGRLTFRHKTQHALFGLLQTVAAAATLAMARLLG